MDMKKYQFVRSAGFCLVFFLTVFSCKNNPEIGSLPQALDSSSSRLSADGEVFNNKQYDDFIYHHLKYYGGTVSYEEFMPEDFMAKFKPEFERQKQMYDDRGWDFRSAVPHLVEQGYYTEGQATLYLSQMEDMMQYLESHPKAEEFMEWADGKQREIIDSPDLSHAERSQILNEITVIQSALRYKLETMPESAKHPRNGRVVSDCNFWEALRCWLGYVGGISGLSGTASTIVAGITSVSTGIAVIGGIIGIAVGTVQAIQNCDCNYDVCQAPQGVSFPYVCYTPTSSNSLRFTAWGYGNITPSQFQWQFWKNNNTSSANNFYGNFTANNYIDLPGSTIISHSVQTVALNSDALCSGTTKNSHQFGWYDLNELGKPYFAISGPLSISAADAAYYVGGYDYNALGPIRITQNVSIQWEILPGQPGYTATGTILFGANSAWVRVRWDGTPGFATLKCTATTACHTEVKYYNVHIYQ